MSTELTTVVDTETPINTPMAAPDQVSGLAPVVQAIINGNADTDALDRLLDAQERYDQMQAKKAFNDAMTGFRRDVNPAKKSAQNAHLKNFYATFDDMLKSASPALAANGLNIEFDTEQPADLSSVKVVARVTHTMGHSKDTSLASPIEQGKGVNRVQAMAAVISYLKRYTMAALLGMATEDNDATSATPAPAEPMIGEQEMQMLEQACKDAGKDWAKYLAWKSKNSPLVDGVLQIPLREFAAAEGQIRRGAK